MTQELLGPLVPAQIQQEFRLLILPDDQLLEANAKP